MLLVDEVRRRPREDRSGSGLMFGSRYKAGGKSWLPSPSLGHILWLGEVHVSIDILAAQVV